MGLALGPTRDAPLDGKPRIRSRVGGEIVQLESDGGEQCHLVTGVGEGARQVVRVVQQPSPAEGLDLENTQRRRTVGGFGHAVIINAE